MDRPPSPTSPLRRRPAAVLVLTLAVVALGALPGAPTVVAQEGAPAGGQHLPTPYTADQIRDAWFEGFEVLALYDLPQGTRRVLTTVRKWSQEGAMLAEQPVDEEGNPQGEPRVYEVSWQELRNHALFPADSSSREHVTRSTPLGELEGWLYKRTEEDGSVSEFFFADGMAGAPVVAQRVKDGQTLFQVLQLERSERP